MITTIFATKKVVNYENGNRVDLNSTVIANRLVSLYKSASGVSPMVM